METTTRKPTLQKISVYEVRLVRARRALRIAETTVSDGELAARTMHAMLGLTDREHFAVLFLNGRHQVNGAHVVAIGGQHGIVTIEPRTVFRAAIAACASAIVLGHNHPSGDPAPSADDIATPQWSSPGSGREAHALVLRDYRASEDRSVGSVPLESIECQRRESRVTMR